MADDFKTEFLADKDKVNLTSADLFDRVINLKLFVKDKDGNLKDTYVIRSDYEIYYPELMKSVAYNAVNSFTALNKGFVRKCQHKPSIKVQYKRVSLNSSVEVDIFVHNFYLLDKNGEMISGFNNETYQLSRVDFSMGYFGQFKELFADKKPQSGKELVEMGFLEDITSDPSVGHGITVMTMSNVVYTQLDRLPPDSILHIHGYVGNTHAPVNFDNTDFATSYNDIMKSQFVIPPSLKGDMTTYLERVYYEMITRHFLNKSTASKAIMAQLAGSSEKVTGALSDSSAKQYGIKVYLSKGAKEYSKNEKEAKFKKDADGKAVEDKVTIAQYDVAEEQMNAIESALHLSGFTHFIMPVFGDYIVCLKSELNDIKSLLSDTTFEKVYKNTTLAKSWKNCIPAVYNITTDALCTITCPFFCFINPFEVLKFKSRYALGGLVSYYANYSSANKYEFYALWQTVSFATVEDVNECMIVCTGQSR